MAKCPNCGNEKVEKLYIYGSTTEEGLAKKNIHCDKCTKDAKIVASTDNNNNGAKNK